MILVVVILAEVMTDHSKVWSDGYNTGLSIDGSENECKFSEPLLKQIWIEAFKKGKEMRDKQNETRN